MTTPETIPHQDAPDDIDCHGALAVLHEFLRKECDPDLERKVHAHLERCLRCFRSAAFERNYFRLLEEHAAKVRCPEALRARVLAAIARQA